MQVFLELSGHPKANVRRVMLSRTTVVGRSRECGLQIASASVSRKHCELHVSDEGVSVTDLGSSNGTFVEAERLPAGERRHLPSGSRLNVGGVRFVITYTAKPSESLPEPAGQPASAAAVAAAAPTAASVLDELDDEPILDEGDFVFDLPIAQTVPAGKSASVDNVAELSADDEPDLSAMFADEPVTADASATESGEVLAEDEPILASDEDDAFAFLTGDEPAVEKRREDSRLGAS
jgi:predicted component of type VI protein secretion system